MMNRSLSILLAALTFLITAACANVSTAAVYVKCGNAALSIGDYDNAIADYTEAIRLNPNNASAYYCRGFVYGEKGDHDRAIADNAEAIRLDPNNKEAYYNRGNTYGKKGRFANELYKPVMDYTIPDGPIDDELIYLSETQNSIRNVPRIIAVLHRRGVFDANKDGLVNCIDYSMVFAALYGSDARLIVNKNYKNGMNHMFVRILIGPDYMDIEPQGSPNDFTMSESWGAKYDPQYNMDVTGDARYLLEEDKGNIRLP